MSTGPAKVFIKVETSSEQQENLKNSRKNLKIIQKSAQDKENLIGRAPLTPKSLFTKSKSETEIRDDNIIDAKRKRKLVSSGSQTESELKKALDKITEEDLTTEGEPSEAYWKVLAEKRRIALDISLKENEELHERITTLEEELSVSRTMLEETKNLVEILTEMIDENETEKGECSKTSLGDASYAEEAVESMVLNSTFDEKSPGAKIHEMLKTPIKQVQTVEEESESDGQADNDLNEEIEIDKKD